MFRYTKQVFAKAQTITLRLLIEMINNN